MKTNEMFNEYVQNNGLGAEGQTEFVEKFIAALGLECDGRLVKIKLAPDWITTMRASTEGVTDLLVRQIMSKGFGNFVPFDEPFEIIECAQPSIRWEMHPDGTITSRTGNLAEALEGGMKNAAMYEDD